MEHPKAKRHTAIAFGLDRISLVALAHPIITAIFLAIVVAVTSYGLTQVSVDRDLRNIFRGETEAYEQYAEVSTAYADPENQIMVLVEVAALRTPAALQRLAGFQLDLQFTDGIASVFSMFSLRSATDAPVVDPAVGLDDATIAAVRSHALGGESLLSADGDTALLLVNPATERASIAEHTAIGAEIEALLAPVEAATGLSLTVTGQAKLRTEIVHLLERDQIVLNLAGLVIGFLLSLFLFRSSVAALMTAIPAAVGGLSLMGWSAAFGVEVTIMSNIVPVLVMILGYADGMHITYAWRRFRDEGMSPVEAERAALDEVGPACMLAALTTGVAFLSMAISDVAMIRQFGIVGAAGVFIGTWLVLIAHSLTARLLGPRWNPKRTVNDTPMGWLAGPLGRITGFATSRPRLISSIAIVATLAFASLFLAVPPENSLQESLPSNSDAAVALEVVDQELGGVAPVQIIVPIDDTETISVAGLARIRAVHEAVAAVPDVFTPVSLWSLAAGIPGTPEEVVADLNDTMFEMPEETLGRFLGTPGALVTANIHSLTTAQTRLLVDTIEEAAVSVVPDAIVTGATVLSAREATRTIRNLNVSLAIDVVVTIFLIGIAFRRASIGLVALIPNLLPIAATGSLLFFLGKGMQFTSIVSLTIAYGIAVDDTVHYLNTLVREGKAARLRDRIRETTHKVGPVLIGTTLVIVCGMSATLTSGLPSVALFGMLAATSLLVAMAGDLLVLPALIAGPFRSWFGGGRKDEAGLATAEPAPVEPAPATPAS